MSVQIGEVTLDTPVVLSPMAGVTNVPFRQICREFAEAGLLDAGAGRSGVCPSIGDGVPESGVVAHASSGITPLDECDADSAGEMPQALAYPPVATRFSVHADGTRARAGLFVCEMITTRALVEGKRATLQMVEPDHGDPVRSIQLYGVQPGVTAAAVRQLIAMDVADHIDLNFGCPVPKVTKKGGGSALPWKHDLYKDLVTAAVREAEAASREYGRTHIVPVTAKIRIGIDDDHETMRSAAKIAVGAGIAGLTLHARTLEQHYSGHARWDEITRLKEYVDGLSGGRVPLFGNGDVFEADDAERMMAETGADGVAIGRGAQGRPWIFYDMAAAYAGSACRALPSLGEVVAVIRRHAELLVVQYGDELKALRAMRGHIASYLRGFSCGGDVRHQLGLVTTLQELDERLALLDWSEPYPSAVHGARGRAGGAKRAHLPEHWLDSHELNVAQRERIQDAELDISGG